MNDRQADVLKATAAAQAARERLSGTVTALQGRLEPRRLVREVRHGLTDRNGSALATARRHPAIGLGGLVVLGLLLARRVRRKTAPIVPAPSPNIVSGDIR